MVDFSCTRVTHLKGVGDALAHKLARLGIVTLQDLIFHLPLRYQDRTHIVPIRSLVVGQDAVIEGDIISATVIQGRRRSLLVKLQDHSGIIGLRFYYFNQAQANTFKKGGRVRCFSDVRLGASGLELYHPEYRLMDEVSGVEVEQTLTPIYPTTEGLAQQRLRGLVAQTLKLLSHNSLPDYIPAVIREKYGLADLTISVRYLHQPTPDANHQLLAEGKQAAIQRLIFEELLAHQLSLQTSRHLIRLQSAPSLRMQLHCQDMFLKQLPFQLTNAQQRVTQEILYDLAQNKPMLRLVQGDVGAGKTVVAALAALAAITSGFQVALMAPTEILAEQHYLTFQRWFEPLGIQVVWLAGKLKTKERKQVLEAICSTAQMVIGTHALFQEEVKFSQLALVIIDEQHRFGVAQRLSLRDKVQQGQVPHQLVMTATPIPRTLAMSLYADLDTSVLDELPPNRMPVTTLLVADSRREEVLARVSQLCLEGKQIYWVCTLIDESEELVCQAAETTYIDLKALLPDLSVGLVHGRMRSSEKAAMMVDFKAGNIQLLVATTVIEVGVDVPNASLMVIENAERLGLAQLHQLRGRVGRGSQQSFCILLYHPPLSNTARQRLAIMRQTNDGFLIAEKDLEIRGPGEVLGTRQSGEMQFKIADLVRDSDLLPTVREAAKEIVDLYPERVDRLLDRWIKDAGQYIHV